MIYKNFLTRKGVSVPNETYDKRYNFNNIYGISDSHRIISQFLCFLKRCQSILLINRKFITEISKTATSSLAHHRITITNNFPYLYNYCKSNINSTLRQYTLITHFFHTNNNIKLQSK